jgi:rod shape-determining protein MreD
VKVLRVLAAIALTLAVQTTLARLTAFGTLSMLDLPLVVVVYVGLTSGPTAGLLTGTVAGLGQDALSGGILGIGGLAKTIVGFFAGVIGTQFILVNAVPRFIVFFGATLIQAACVIGLYWLLEARILPASYGLILRQAGGNAVVGVLSFYAIERLPGLGQRWQRRRRL